MKKSISLLAQSVFLLMCSVAVAQIPDRPSSTSESPLIRQIADITVLGDSGVVVLLVDENGVVNQKLRLAGPYVKLLGSPGNAISVGDLNSPSVAGVLEDDAAVFLGDLELIPTPISPDSSQSENWRATVYNSLVEIRTEWVTEDQVENPAATKGEVPLNQRPEHIRAVLEEVRKRRGQ